MTLGRESAANDMLAKLVKESVFKFEFDVDAPAPSREKLAVARPDEHEPGHVPSQAPTSKSPLPAATGAKGKSPKQATNKEVQLQPAAPAPAAKRTKATAQPPAQAKGGALAVSALKQTIRSGAVDVCADLCSRLDEGDADTIALLTKIYPAHDTKRECVFCWCKFVSGGSSTCTAIHDVDEFGDYEQAQKGGSGNYGTFSGECSRCRKTTEADGPENGGPDTRDLEECYCGPHRRTNSTSRRFGSREVRRDTTSILARMMPSINDGVFHTNSRPVRRSLGNLSSTCFFVHRKV